MRALARIGRSRHAARSLRLPTSRSLAPLAPSLSRGFRALKVWSHLREPGADKRGETRRGKKLLSEHFYHHVAAGVTGPTEGALCDHLAHERGRAVVVERDGGAAPPHVSYS